MRLSGQVVAYDFGIKHNILRRLASYGCRITVVPANYPAAKVLEMNPDGVFFSNGPVRKPPDTPLCQSEACLDAAAPVLVVIASSTPFPFPASAYLEAATFLAAVVHSS